ncbi:endonuclease domain-containing protein [Allopontixanthobacter sp.]|uniref:endonuclease domain-containing protein n=1 Tax=Allopontixanthobacter sp. TaxID=2906452 RepID=UPI002AB9ADDD|nr:endonuclease domain-containing protein [Allopontixanthobacter sp.]MDZ4306977.1 endonuclease domain-containing protein [Allopontixanthobacter sp.]
MGGGRTEQRLIGGGRTEPLPKSGKPTRQTLLKRAAEMRLTPPEPERRLWMELRNSRLNGAKFRRQAVIGTRIADFFCPSKGLIVEVDGQTHDRVADLAKDRLIERTTGFQTLRFTNDEIMQNMNGVLERLTAVLETQADRWPGGGAHHPQTPSSEEEGA